LKGHGTVHLQQQHNNNNNNINIRLSLYSVRIAREMKVAGGRGARLNKTEDNEDIIIL